MPRKVWNRSFGLLLRRRWLFWGLLLLARSSSATCCRYIILFPQWLSDFRTILNIILYLLSIFILLRSSISCFRLSLRLMLIRLNLRIIISFLYIRSLKLFAIRDRTGRSWWCFETRWTFFFFDLFLLIGRVRFLRSDWRPTLIQRRKCR